MTLCFFIGRFREGEPLIVSMEELKGMTGLRMVLLPEKARNQEEEEQSGLGAKE